MGTFTSHFPRDIAAQYGREAVSIGERGEYHAPSGRIVDIHEQVKQAVQSTVSYPPDVVLNSSFIGQHDTKTEVTNETTLSAAARLVEQGFKPVALSFASATSPGGGFLSGSRAQEEYLARSSCLYQCIRDNPMYVFHRLACDPLYTDFVLYSPEVPVIRSDDGFLLESPYTLSFITAAAVNANQVPPERRKEISPAMWTRVLKVLAVGVAHGHNAIILGAWGCGAFGNDADLIASLFQRALEENFKGAYRKVVFAIVDWSTEKRFIAPFERAFAKKGRGDASREPTASADE
jgi:uncharacterized protein (TIGR02452 family)